MADKPKGLPLKQAAIAYADKAKWQKRTEIAERFERRLAEYAGLTEELDPPLSKEEIGARVAVRGPVQTRQSDLLKDLEAGRRGATGIAKADSLEMRPEFLRPVFWRLIRQELATLSRERLSRPSRAATSGRLDLRKLTRPSVRSAEPPDDDRDKIVDFERSTAKVGDVQVFDVRVFESMEAAEKYAREARSVKNPRKAVGRPRTYDWDAFYIEVVKIANMPDGLPDSQAELQRVMAQWFQNSIGDEPGTTVLKHRIRQIYDAIEKVGN